MKAPVALLFTKADVLTSKESYNIKENRQRTLSTITSYLPDLVKWCTEHCSNFEMFLVSSVGYLEDGHPPKELKPFGVIDAISWILKYL